LKLLDLDNDEYEKIPHRYRTRVDADAAALELLCLSCDDEIGKNKANSFRVIFRTWSNAHITSQSLILDLTSQSTGLFSTYVAAVYHQYFFFFFISMSDQYTMVFVVLKHFNHFFSFTEDLFVGIR
jgi:hypothetical protein